MVMTIDVITQLCYMTSTVVLYHIDRYEWHRLLCYMASTTWYQLLYYIWYWPFTKRKLKHHMLFTGLFRMALSILAGTQSTYKVNNEEWKWKTRPASKISKNKSFDEHIEWVSAENNKRFMAGPEGNIEFCFPRLSMFPKTKSRETLRFEGNEKGPVIKWFVI